MLTCNSSPKPQLVRMSQAKEVFGFSADTGYRYARKGLLKLVKLGRGTFIVTDSLKLEEMPQKSAA